MTSHAVPAGGASVGHADRPVSVTTHDGRPAVRKTYHAGGADAVHGQMTALWASSFGRGRHQPGMPEPLALEADPPAVVMGRSPGEPLGRRGAVDDSVRRSSDVALLLADLHGSGVVVDRRRDPGKLLRSARRKSAELADSAGTAQQAAVAGACRAVVDSLGGVRPPDSPLVVSHGDFSPRNVLDGPDGLVLIDFDRLQMAEPARDLTYWGAWIWVTRLQIGEAPSWDAADRLIDDYAVHRPGIRSTDPASWAFHRAIALVRIAHGWSALAADPDLALLVLGEASRVALSSARSRW